MSFLFDESYYKIGKNGVSPAQNMCAYLGGSAIQTVGDNPVTAYRQLVQQYAKDVNGNTVAPKVAVGEANATFRANPIGASLSGLWPRLIGVLLKRVPKFGFLLGYSHFVGEGTPGFAAATCASICSAPFINPVRLVEKQQRAYFKQTGQAKPVGEILRESAAKNFLPLFRGTIPLMGHSPRRRCSVWSASLACKSTCRRSSGLPVVYRARRRTWSRRPSSRRSMWW